MSASVEEPSPAGKLVRSKYVSTFAHMGEVYVYHDLYGYILEMSPDILDFLEEFREPVKPDTICSKYANAFGEQTPESFVGIFLQFRCLVEPGSDELDGIWEMVPVRGRWNVWERTDDGGLVLYTAWGDRPVRRHALTAEETLVWDGFDSETRLSTLAGEHGMDVVGALIERLVHHDVQAVKLSALPLSYYKGRQHMKPPYLTSTMPYAPYDPRTDELPPGPGDLLSPEAYYRREVDDAEAQFDHGETTLSHLLRRPHPALGGRTYGQALVDGLAERGLLPEGRVEVLEIGGGLGEVARSAVEALQARGLEVSWDILELSPVLATAQREAMEGLPVRIHEGEALTSDWPAAEYDLVLSNEMIGDLPAEQMTHARAGLDRDDLEGDALQAHLSRQGIAGRLVAKYTLPIGDAPDPFYINTGAIQLLERIREHLRPGGVAWVSEFGHIGRWPILSTQLDHPELSIHFGHLTMVARELGLETDFEFVMDVLDLDRDAKGLATTRSYFRALRALLEDHDVTLDKVGYTEAMFRDLVSEHVDLDRIGELEFHPIEDRLMGLVPHEFKALVLKKPTGG
ncbi:MAG: class I SAM-dependent methyltransferase [Myxococcota bacterium]